MERLEIKSCSIKNSAGNQLSSVVTYVSKKLPSLVNWCPIIFVAQFSNIRKRRFASLVSLVSGLMTQSLCLVARFMEDLQAEVQEMEFLQFSKGMDTMRREDFAEWLLHYTNEADNETYWENMRKKIPAGQVKKSNKLRASCLCPRCKSKRIFFFL